MQNMNKKIFYWSFQFAFLFSTKAVMPSLLSSVAKVAWKSFFSVARPSFRVFS